MYKKGERKGRSNKSGKPWKVLWNGHRTGKVGDCCYFEVRKGKVLVYTGEQSL